MSRQSDEMLPGKLTFPMKAATLEIELRESKAGRDPLKF